MPGGTPGSLGGETTYGSQPPTGTGTNAGNAAFGQQHGLGPVQFPPGFQPGPTITNQFGDIIVRPGGVIVTYYSNGATGTLYPDGTAILVGPLGSPHGPLILGPGQTTAGGNDPILPNGRPLMGVGVEEAHPGLTAASKMPPPSPPQTPPVVDHGAATLQGELPPQRPPYRPFGMEPPQGDGTSMHDAFQSPHSTALGGQRPPDTSGGLGNSPAPPPSNSPNSPQSGLPKPPEGVKPSGEIIPPKEPLPQIASPQEPAPPPKVPAPAPPANQLPQVQPAPAPGSNSPQAGQSLADPMAGKGSGSASNKLPPLLDEIAAAGKGGNVNGGTGVPVHLPGEGVPKAPDGSGRPDYTGHPPDAIEKVPLNAVNAIAGIAGSAVNPSNIGGPKVPGWYDANNPNTWLPDWKPGVNGVGGTFGPAVSAGGPSSGPGSMVLNPQTGQMQSSTAPAGITGSGIAVTANPNPFSVNVPVALAIIDKGGQVAAGAPAESWSFDAGDGSSSGTLALNTWNHTYTAAGTYTVTGTVKYTNGKTGTATLALSSMPNPPPP